jgi:hypothetical protein
MSLREVQPLLRICKPKTDESFMGYIVRLTEKNFYESSVWIFMLAGSRWYANNNYYKSSITSGKLSRLPHLSKLTRTSESELTKIIYPAASTTNPKRRCSRYSVFGNFIPWYFIRITHPKICPYCLLESAYCRKIWELAPVTACPIHKCMLLDACPNCLKPIAWRRSKVSRCSCEFDWRDASSQQLNDAELIVSWQIHHLCNLQKGDSLEVTSETINPLLFLELEPFLKALLFVAGQLGSGLNQKGIPSSLSNLDLHNHLSEAFAVFQDWPQNYHEFLRGRQRKVNTSLSHTGFKRDFGDFYSGLYRSLSPNCFGFMRSAFQEYLGAHWEGGYAANINRRTGTELLNTKYIPRYKARERLKVETTYIDQLIERGDLRAIVSKQRKKRIILIEVDSIEELKLKFEGMLSLKDTSKLLNISVHPILNLVHHECLKPSRGRSIDGYPEWRFNRQVIQDLLGELRNMISRKTHSTIQKTLNFQVALRKLSKYNFSTGRLVRAMLDGEIRPCGEGQEEGLQSFLFDALEISEYSHQQLQKLRGDDLSIVEAGKILGLRESAAFFLARKGILPTRTRSDNKRLGARVCREDIALFTSTYEIASKLSQRLGMSSGSLINLLATYSVRPISGPRVDGGIQYLFKRSDFYSIDLAAIASEYKTTYRPIHDKDKLFSLDQTADILRISKETIVHLIECGLLTPTSQYQQTDDQRAKYLFSGNVIESYKLQFGNREPCKLVSVPRASQMLGESLGRFHDTWLRRSFIKTVQPKGKLCRKYVSLEDVKSLMKLKQTTFTEADAALLMGVNRGFIRVLKTRGHLKPISGPHIDGVGFNLYLRTDVEKLCTRGITSKALI